MHRESVSLQSGGCRAPLLRSHSARLIFIERPPDELGLITGGQRRSAAAKAATYR